MTPEEPLRQVAERLRERARQMPAGEAIEPDPVPTPSAAADRPADAKPGRAARPPKHWAETDLEPDDHQEDEADEN